MATAAQITANRSNAQHSTGPRTVEGKATSSKNHTSHGLSSKEFVILPGQQAEFDEFMAALRESVKPSGAIELDLFQQLAHASWTLRRCRAAEAELHNGSGDPELDPLNVPHLDERLRLIDLYTRRVERAYHRALQQLKALQTEREFLTDLQAAGATTNTETPLATRKSLSKHRQLLAQAHAAKREAAAISRFESYIVPPTISEPRMSESGSTATEHSNPIRSTLSATLKARSATR